MARRSLYDRRCRDADFAAGWDDTREAFEETLTPRAIVELPYIWARAIGYPAPARIGAKRASHQWQ